MSLGCVQNQRKCGYLILVQSLIFFWIYLLLFRSKECLGKFSYHFCAIKISIKEKKIINYLEGDKFDSYGKFLILA